jgi:hypothetical protein
MCSRLSLWERRSTKTIARDVTGLKVPDATEKPGYRPADLTQISKRHHGKFPREMVYDVIDGGKRLPGHYDFDSPMPLWGMNFQLEGKEYTAESEAAVTRRINALVDYVQSIQQR